MCRVSFLDIDQLYDVILIVLGLFCNMNVMWLSHTVDQNDSGYFA